MLYLIDVIWYAQVAYSVTIVTCDGTRFHIHFLCIFIPLLHFTFIFIHEIFICNMRLHDLLILSIVSINLLFYICIHVFDYVHLLFDFIYVIICNHILCYYCCVWFTKFPLFQSPQFRLIL